MAVNQIRVTSRSRPTRRGLASRLRMPLVALLLLSPVLGVLGFDYYSGRLGLIWAKNEITERAGGRVIKVPPGGNLQGAIDSAQSGDIVELQAGAVYSGQINLSNKPLTDYVTIQSSAVADLPPDKRVSPAQRGSMAIIQSGILGRAAVSAANGAHHYRFVGIEFTPSSTVYTTNLIITGGRETRPADVSHHIEIDRSYIHPHQGGTTRRGIALNSADTTIKNSYIEGIGFDQEETQGICGWTGARNVKITNNYIEGGAENIMFGGADPANAELIPSDIEITGNHLSKPRAWLEKTTVKTLFELKDAKRVKFTGNYLENNWKGSAFRITVRNQDGAAPFSTIEDVTIRDNIIDGAGEGVNILGSDDTYPSQTAKRVDIINNLFLNMGGGVFEGSGYFLQIAGGESITIAANTVFNEGNTVTFYGDLPRNLVIRDNILSHGVYGVHGLGDLRSSSAPHFFVNNIVVNNKHVDRGDASFPPDGFWLPDYQSVGFLDLEGKKFGLGSNSRYRGKASDGGDIGCNVTTLPTESVRSVSK